MIACRHAEVDRHRRPCLEEAQARVSGHPDRPGFRRFALVLGDSHEYGLSVDPFNKQVIDELILTYTQSFLEAPQMEIQERWHGVYAKHPEKPLVVITPADGVRIVASPGGAGMTLSLGVAERSMREMGIRA